MMKGEHLENVIEEIRIDQKDEVKGFYTLLNTNKHIICLPDNKYVVPRQVLKEIENKGIGFEIKKK